MERLKEMLMDARGHVAGGIAVQEGRNARVDVDARSGRVGGGGNSLHLTSADAASQEVSSHG